MASATNLADFTRCAHRVFLDANGDATEILPSATLNADGATIGNA